MWTTYPITVENNGINTTTRSSNTSSEIGSLWSPITCSHDIHPTIVVVEMTHHLILDSNVGSDDSSLHLLAYCWTIYVLQFAYHPPVALVSLHLVYVFGISQIMMIGCIHINIIISSINDKRTIVTRLTKNYACGEQDSVSLGLVKTVVQHWLLVWKLVHWEPTE